VPVEQAGKIWRITGIKSFKGEGGNFKLDASIDGQPVKFLQNGGSEGLEPVNRLPVTTRARVVRLSALETRNMLSRNAIQNLICIIKPGAGHYIGPLRGSSSLLAL